MTGANFVVAESGTIALVTNEGNARKCAVTPDTHVAVAGVEKIVPTVADLQPFSPDHRQGRHRPGRPAVLCC